MIDAHPLFLLQSPPGTGKTRALSEAIFHVLAKGESSAKIFVSAQSHASVDTTLQRIAKTFRDKLSEDIGERFHMIRYMSAVDKERIASSVRDGFALDSVVARVARRMRSKADEELDRLLLRSGDEPSWQSMRRTALQLLRNASNEFFDEIERRVQRNASLHFTTSSAVHDDTISMFGMEGKFHTAVIEEAAKVWGASLIQPLIMARKGILIGDHKQIGPFDSARYNRLAIMACGGDPNDGLPGHLTKEADPIFPQYRDEPMAMANWLETFRRIFVRYESGALERKQSGVRMADTLDTRFRSTREIGELVSHAFYDRKVVYGDVARDMERRLIGTEGFGAVGGGAALAEHAEPRLIASSRAARRRTDRERGRGAHIAAFALAVPPA
ncbi:MAG: AAA domain-containing protein [Breoghania sp.]|nr:AAA domain-containing protein [Breoghania sp.]MDJ0933377.1 AAA domain-containing protein [Breoghania sp.]